ncbi:MAG: hypothetical protein ACOCUD_02855 [Bacillota bacterium]
MKHNHYKIRNILFDNIPFLYTTYKVPYFYGQLNFPRTSQVRPSYKTEFDREKEARLAKHVGNTKKRVFYGKKVSPCIVKDRYNITVAYYYKYMDQEYRLFETLEDARKDILNNICKFEELK